MCDDVFYDPCKCDEGQTCYESVFEKATCDNARIFDIRSYVNDPEAQLTSLHWPDSISPQESQDEATNQRLNDLLADVMDTPFDAKTLFASLQESVQHSLDHLDIPEGDTPHDFCDDLLDYWPEDAQHPVGYHPTCSCLRDDTNIRGFDAWMSAPRGYSTEDFSYVIENTRFC